jgi:hypothetical protein
MAMVGHKTEAIYRRYAIVDEQPGQASPLAPQGAIGVSTMDFAVSK